MNKLVIIGAGQQGRNCKRLAEELGVEVVAFVDDNVDGEVEGIKVFPRITDIENYTSYKYIIGIGDMFARKKYVELIKNGNLDCMTLIDPNAIIEEGAVIGKGNYIYKLAVIYASAEIGDHNIINTKACIATDAVIGNNCNICMGANILGDVHIGDNSIIGYNATIKSGYNVGKNCEVEANSMIYVNVADNTYVQGTVKYIDGGKVVGKT